jgi:hypothetical protein
MRSLMKAERPALHQPEVGAEVADAVALLAHRRHHVEKLGQQALHVGQKR